MITQEDFEYIQGIRDLEFKILDQSGSIIPHRKISEVADKMVDEIYEQTKNEKIDVVDAIKEIHERVAQEYYEKAIADVVAKIKKEAPSEESQLVFESVDNENKKIWKLVYGSVDEFIDSIKRECRP